MRFKFKIFLHDLHVYNNDNQVLTTMFSQALTRTLFIPSSTFPPILVITRIGGKVEEGIDPKKK